MPLSSKGRTALRALGARLAAAKNAKKPVTKGQNLPNGGWGSQTTPAKIKPGTKFSNSSLDAQ
jgi:hypothetical protein